MILIGSTGFNMSRDVAARLGIEMTEQLLVIDGRKYAVEDISLDELDGFFKTATTYPYPINPTAAEFVSVLAPLIARDRDFLVLTASRKMTGAYDAASSAARTLMQHQAFKQANIRVIDSGVTEIGIALTALRCAAAIKAGASNVDVMDICHAMIASSYQVFVPETLEPARNSGRATFLKTFAASFLKVLPVLHLADGELKSARTIPRDADKVTAIVEQITSRYGSAKPKAWIAITHGLAPTLAYDLEHRLRTVFDVKYLINRVMTPALYSVSGRGCLGASVALVDDRFSGPP